MPTGGDRCGRLRAERRDAGVAFTILSNIDDRLMEKSQILKRWIEHSRSVPNRPSAISGAAIDRLPQVESSDDLSLPSSFPKSCFILHGVYDGAYPHHFAPNTRALPLSTIATSNISAQTSAATTTTTTSTTPAIDSNAPGAASTTILTITIPASRDVDSVLSCPHYNRIFIPPIGLVRHLRIQRLANQCQETEHTLTASTFTVHIHSPQGPIDYMRIHNSGIHRRTYTPSTSYISTNFSIPRPTNCSSFRAPITKSTITTTPEADSTARDLSG
nr:unnamed protein product [Spirometra erinaceieuropaei]